MIDKIRVQMDAFLEDGSHEAIIAVVRTLAAALPLSASSLRDYILDLQRAFEVTYCSGNLWFVIAIKIEDGVLP